MFKYSPGPWKWHNGDLLDARDMPVIEIRVGYDVEDQGLIAKDSDARLIAAAPEMFSLLRDICNENRLEDTRMGLEVHRLVGRLLNR